MKRGMIKYSLVIGSLFVWGNFLLSTHAAAATSTLLIQSLQIGSTADATDESVKIVNVGPGSIDLKGLVIEYKAATGMAWTKKAGVVDSHMLSPGSAYVAANKQAHDIALTAGLAQGGGNLRLMLAHKVLDQVAWGNGNSPEGTAVAAPTNGQVIERACEPTCLDTDNNSADFRVGGSVSEIAQSQAVTESPVYSIEITELLPDPASPQTDARDEYIEIYNAGGQVATLNGWQLTSGKQSYKLEGIQLAVGQYLALTAATTKLGLANTGDTVSLIDAAGNVVMITPSYSAATVGKSYGITGGIWAWLDHPTPNTANASALVEEDTPEKTPKPTAKKSAATAKKSTNSTKATSAKSVASAVKEAAKSTSTQTDAEPTSTFSSGWVLAILGIFAIGYGVYEYRPELLSLYARLRAKSRAGREPVQNPKPGRRR